MPLFEDRERAEETRYARRQEMVFRIKARRNKMLALWAAEKMGKSGAEARRYATEFARRDIADHNDDALIARIRDEFLAEGIFMHDDEIRRHIEKFGRSAAQQPAPTPR